MKKDKKSCVSDAVIGLSILLTLVFLILKLTGQLAWAWVWILAPLWGTYGLLVALTSIGAIAAAIKARIKGREQK